MDQELLDALIAVDLESVTLNSDETIVIQDGITLVVGPNNVGKSLLLSEIQTRVSHGPHLTGLKIVKGLSLKSAVSWDQVLETASRVLDRNGIGIHQPANLGESPVLTLPSVSEAQGGIISLNALAAEWTNTGGSAAFNQSYTLALNVENRFYNLRDQSQWDAIHGKPSYPLQHLYLFAEKEEELSRETEIAFGQKIFLNRAGSTLSLHLGQPRNPQTLPPTLEYLEELPLIPKVNEQGHGMQAFVSILLYVMVGSNRLILIDEPEAFLHPPQARSLARALLRRRRSGTRIIVATHSTDIIKGFTEASMESASLSIHRITRLGNSNFVASVPTESVRRMHQDPLLKHSSILDGLFYNGVVLCEAEGDSTYYAAVNSVANDQTRETTSGVISDLALDLHYTHAYSNNRLAGAVQILRSAKVPVATITDADTLVADGPLLKDLVDAHQGDYSHIQSWINTVRSAVAAKEPDRLKRSVVAAKLQPILEDASLSDDLSAAELSSIKSALKGKTSYTLFKESGRGFLQGDSFSAFNMTVDYLNRIGIFPVEVGELERFHPEVPNGNKPKWLQVVLEQEKYKKSGVQHEFIARVRAYIATLQS